MKTSFEDIIEHWDGRLRKAFLDAVQLMRNGAQIEQIARMLDKGDVEGALRAVGLDPSQFRVFDKAIVDAFEAGGAATASSIPTYKDAQGFRVKIQFNIRNPAAEDWLRNHSGNLIREVFDDQNQMMRDVMVSGMSKGTNPRTVALDLVGRIGANGVRQGGLIGLTRSQMQWVVNYAHELTDDPLKSLTRTLRDKRFDKTVKAYAARDEEVPLRLATKMLRAYNNRALRYRAETIARKEAITALHTAQEQAMQQAVQSGAIASSTITYAWRTARDKRVRDTHFFMDGQHRPFGLPFVTGSGARLRYPGDPAGPAAEVINCRCWREPKVDFLAGIK
ncbi:phage minor head protein [Tardiphaga sp. 839_C3_N1_4]|uniref:phage minor head protein n=1 Tax=Tardiphaga sp. 839_C3_N1_4 TaxID=3240761 RepID=UPI003F2729CF